MQPPFLGTKVVSDLKLADIEPLIDREALFAGRWQFRQGMDSESWEALKRDRALPILEKLLGTCEANSIIEPKMIYGHFACERDGKALVVTDGPRQFRFDFPRERRAPNRCVADYFPDGFATFQLVTVGDNVTKTGAELFSKHAYSDVFFLKGLAAEAAEATAVLCHRVIRAELGVPEGTGARFSPGYPSFPDLFDQRKIVDLLKAEKIGVSLTERCFLVPEHSTSAVVSVDAKAVQFRP